MRYIDREDLIDVIQEHLLDDSIQMSDAILDSVEDKAIALVSSYISGRYDVGKIFDMEEPIRQPLLIQTLLMIVVYRVVRRNAARKVPEDYRMVYEEALQMLENIQSGRQRLDTLPEVVKDDHKSNPGGLIYGNSTNKDFFI